MQPEPPARWHFPSTGFGQETVQDSATTNFRDSPLDKFVREILQNSTDAHDHNAVGPVEVTFREVVYPSELFGAAELLRHAEAAKREAEKEEQGKQGKLAQQYAAVCETLRSDTIRCLEISDRNTTGLSGGKWEALLIKAGSVKKDGRGSGGGNGVGKNAVFNISAAKTAFYYTCYQNGAGRRRHRREQWMGKSMLSVHQLAGEDERRQHIGFYRPDAQSHEAVEGDAIPAEFRMKTAPGQPNTPPNGTTVTVLGFQPQTDSWMPEIAQSAAANFFYAIHNETLIVN